jgi:hypothetical protein
MTGFEPRFYERAAQRHLAQLTGGPVWTNVAWGTGGAPSTRAEIDAMWARAGRIVPAEAKAHRVDTASAGEIIEKYRRLGFAELMVIAPAFTPAAARALSAAAVPAVRAEVFSPDLTAIAAFYDGDWTAGIPGWVREALATGLHHVRFMLTRPTAGGQLVIGQRRTRIYDAAAISRAVAVLPAPPARILWTPQRFTIPRDLIARRSAVTPLGGFVAVDIDGDRLHQACHACQISPAEPCCPHCALHARREWQLLAAALPQAGVIDVLFSGSRGLHAYLGDEPGIREYIIATARRAGLRIDESVTASVKTTIAFPGSLHAGAMRQVSSLTARHELAPAC